jgi:uncharacterized protein (TIGR02246 family)
MRRPVFTVLSLAFLATACQSATTELTDEQKAEIADEVNGIHAENTQAWKDADFDRGMSYLQNSQDMIFAFEGGLMHGWDTMYNAWAPLFEGVARQEMTFAETHTVVLARDAVCIMAQGTFAYVDEAGGVGPESPFALMMVYVHRDGEWKVALGHESVPTPESM